MNNQKISFNYPEDFIEAANSLQFLPDEETRKQFLSILISSILMM